MNKFLSTDRLKPLILRLILSAITLSLTACNSDTLQLSEGGIGGSGISLGPITGFGSVYVNGVHYNTQRANFYRNGEQVSGQETFRLGEYVSIEGIVNSDKKTGQANNVYYNTLLSGVIETLTATQNTLVIAGQEVHINALTVLYGFTQISALSEGQALHVSGVNDEQGRIIATSLQLSSSNQIPTVMSGSISALNTQQQTFTLNQQTIDYSRATLSQSSLSTLQNGRQVAVTLYDGQSNNSVKSAQLLRELTQPQQSIGSTFEVSGIVNSSHNSSQNSATGDSHFVLQDQVIYMNNQTRLEGVSLPLTAGQFIEVEGYINSSGQWLAEKLEGKSSSDDGEIEGVIEQIDTQAMTLTLNQQTLYADQSTLVFDDEQDSPLRFSDLRVGQRIEAVVIQQTDGRWYARRIDTESEDEDEIDSDDDDEDNDEEDD